MGINKKHIMRIPYKTPTVDQFDRYFNPNYINRGGGLNDIKVYKPHHYAKGGSIFSFLSGVFKRAIPFLRGVMLPEVGEFARNFTADVGNNVPLRDNVKKNLMRSVKNVGRKLVKGGARKNINKKRVNTTKKKKRQRKKCIKKTVKIFSIINHLIFRLYIYNRQGNV